MKYTRALGVLEVAVELRCVYWKVHGCRLFGMRLFLSVLDTLYNRGYSRKPSNVETANPPLGLHDFVSVQDVSPGITMFLGRVHSYDNTLLTAMKKHTRPQKIESRAIMDRLSETSILA